ncbi:hypothetical protein L7F22_031210 [Adiantum nelumboides]|nr:hypothetical protein [Adiantum nelumboides]
MPSSPSFAKKPGPFRANGWQDRGATRSGSYKLRQPRETWFPSDPEGLLRLEQASGLAFQFIIGKTADSRKMAELDEEIEKYSDFLRIDFEEEYLNLPRKTYAGSFRILLFADEF